MDLLKRQKFTNILIEELVPALGCTEPASLALAAAAAREVLGEMPDKIEAVVCGNVIKNVKSVVVPKTGGQKGIETALMAGAIIGKTDKSLELFACLTQENAEDIKKCLKTIPVEVTLYPKDKIFYIKVTLYKGENSVAVTIEDSHANITNVKLNGKSVNKGKNENFSAHRQSDRSFLNTAEIVEYSQIVPLEEVKEVILRQIQYNEAISMEGLKNPWGAQVGRVLLNHGSDIATKVKAAAAAGSDARMSGCELPVVVLSGSGNQGITASVPVIEYAKSINCPQEKLIRALVLSNLVTVKQKTGIGPLSAYCGVVSAACGAAAGICYLEGGGLEEISHTIVNTLAVSSGIICDGAKPSCAAKIAVAVEAGLLGYRMYAQGQQFYHGEGIVSKGVDNTIANVSRLASKGMKSADKEILKIMTDKKEQ